ncbi:MAG: outer membrane lipoprotein chaperone LolA [Gammaproteobacteria bacterium]|nr:outer membrane lipoprotein chaperone LolA [Gammaproteobacteria bacterium]
MRIRLFSLLLIFSSSVMADVSVVDKFFDNLKTLSADFSQSVQNAQLSTVDQSGGKLWISRPGKFRWDYHVPYEQQIVSDGDKIWIYDADLEQVTIKSAKSELGQTPAMLLSGQKPISESFTIKDVGPLNGLDWVELGPKSDEAGFSAIRLGFAKGVLSMMLLQDNLGQMTEINFSHVQRNPSVDQSLFDFKVPQGADVFDSREQ